MGFLRRPQKSFGRVWQEGQAGKGWTALQSSSIFRNDPDFLNESRLKICSACDDKNEAKYRCEECKDTLCDPCYKAHLVVKVTRNHTITDLPHRGTSPLPDGQMEAINRGII